MHASSNRGSTSSSPPPTQPPSTPPSFSTASLQPRNQLRAINSIWHGELLFTTIRHGREKLTPPTPHPTVAPSPCLRHSLNQRILHFRPHPSSHGINWGRSLPAGTETYYFPQSATTDSNSPIHPSSNRGSTFSPTPPPRPQPLPSSFPESNLPAIESTEDDQFQPARRDIISHNLPRTGVIISTTQPIIQQIWQQ